MEWPRSEGGGPTEGCQTDDLKERKTPSSARGERLLPDTLHSAANDERESGKKKEKQKIQQTRKASLVLRPKVPIIESGRPAAFACPVFEKAMDLNSYARGMRVHAVFVLAAIAKRVRASDRDFSVCASPVR